MKKCLYCGEFIDTENDDFQKVGKKVVCVFCYEEYADELDGYDIVDYDSEEDDEKDY